MTNLDTTAARLEVLLERATKGELMTAAHVTKSDYYECPMCDGNGELTATDFCNFDGVAVGVQFYGIGPEFGTHQELWETALKALPALLSERRALKDECERLREALAPFAKAAMGVAIFDPDFPADGAALRASFDWYDKAQDEPRKRHSVRRSDLDKCAALLTANGGEHD